MTLNRTLPPPFEAASSFLLPPAQHTRLTNGIEVIVVRGVQQAVFKIELVTEAGKWVEEVPGASHFCGQLLEKGTTQHTAQQIAKAFDQMGAHVEVSPGYDYTTISLYGLEKNWREAYQLFEEIIHQPVFPEDEWMLQRDIFVENLKVNLEKNSFVASQLIRRNVFGANHPYGSSLTEQQAFALSPSDLRLFHQQHYRPIAAFVTVGPTFRVEPLLDALSRYQQPGTRIGRAYPIVSERKDERIEKPDSSQTAFRIGKQSIRRDAVRYPDFLLFNHLLGGYFGSRLMKNIREEKGLTYGIYSTLQSFRQDSLWVIGAEVNKENRDLAWEEIVAEINRMLQEPVDPAELEIAKSHFLGSLQSEVANPFSVTDKIKNIYLNQLPADFYSSLFDRVLSLSAADILAVGNHYCRPESLTTVAVG